MAGGAGALHRLTTLFAKAGIRRVIEATLHAFHGIHPHGKRQACGDSSALHYSIVVKFEQGQTDDDAWLDKNCNTSRSISDEVITTLTPRAAEPSQFGGF
jgi:hypothetical protein